MTGLTRKKCVASGKKTGPLYEGRSLIAYLDTNIMVWLATGKLRKLSKDAERVVRQANLLVSPMVLLELEYLFDLGRTRLRSRDLQAKVEREVGVQVCELSFRSIAATAIDEGWTTDPFDRLIVANAKANGFASLVSADEEFKTYYPKTVW